MATLGQSRLDCKQRHASRHALYFSTRRLTYVVGMIQPHIASIHPSPSAQVPPFLCVRLTFSLPVWLIVCVPFPGAPCVNCSFRGSACFRRTRGSLSAWHHTISRVGYALAPLRSPGDERIGGTFCLGVIFQELCGGGGGWDCRTVTYLSVVLWVFVLWIGSYIQFPGLFVHRAQNSVPSWYLCSTWEYT